MPLGLLVGLLELSLERVLLELSLQRELLELSLQRELLELSLQRELQGLVPELVLALALELSLLGTRSELLEEPRVQVWKVLQERLWQRQLVRG